MTRVRRRTHSCSGISPSGDHAADVFPALSGIHPEAWTICKPTLNIFTLRDAAGPPALQKQNIETYLPHRKIVELDVGHWVQFEATEQLNTELEDWIEGLGLLGPA